MQFFGKIVSLSAILIMIGAASAYPMDMEIREHRLTAFTAFHDIDFRGSMISPPFDYGCKNVKPSAADRISSIRIDSSFSCYFYGIENCQGRKLLVGEDIRDLSESGFNDYIHSFNCSRRGH